MVRLADIVDIFDGPHATPRKTHDGPIFLGVSSLVNGRLDLSDVAHLSEDDFLRWTRRVIPSPGDVVFSYETRLGEAALIPSGLRCCLGRRMGLLRVISAQVDPRYLLYAYLGPHFQHVIRERTIHGSTVDRIPLKNMGTFPIALPPRAEQDRIVSVLGTLDDKIDRNGRLARLLEQICRTEFQARFVDFIGVEDLDESGLGQIPVGWRAGVLGDIGVVHRDLVKGASDLPYIGLDLMPRGSTVLTEWREEEAPTGQAARFEVGDILFGKLRPYLRKVGVAPVAGRCSTEILVLRPTKPEYYGALLGHVASEAFIEHCVAVSRGTRMPRAEWKDASAFQIAIPPIEEATTFSALVHDLYAKVRCLTHESRTLAAIRDSLLPRLISGEIRLPDTADTGEVIEPLVDVAT